MKKILYITTVSGTINAFLVPHIKQLIKEGYKVDCACKITTPVTKELTDLGVEVIEVPFSRSPLDIDNIKAFKELCIIQKTQLYDAVHVHTPIASLYGRLLKLKFKDLKTIYTVHGFHFYKGAPKKNWIIYYPIEKIMSKLTDTIITMNEEDYNQALKFNIKNTYKVNGVGIDLSHYNPKLYDKNEIRKELNLKESDFVILMIAEINKNKNHIQMIKAIEILKEKGIAAKVICAGRGPLLENMKEEIRNRNLDKNIFMLGFRKDVPKLIAACDVGMLLSYREGLPRNIMELMAYSKPVIGTDIRGIRDLISKQYLVNVGDEYSLASKIEYMYSNVQEREAIKEYYKTAICKYDIKNVKKELDDIYKYI